MWHIRGTSDMSHVVYVSWLHLTSLYLRHCDTLHRRRNRGQEGPGSPQYFTLETLLIFIHAAQIAAIAVYITFAPLPKWNCFLRLCIVQYLWLGTYDMVWSDNLIHAYNIASSPGPTRNIGKGTCHTCKLSCMCWVSILCDYYVPSIILHYISKL